MKFTARKKNITLIAAFCLLLASCTLLMGPQASLINSLFEKFVGVSPLDAKIFEHPLIKGRMQDLLGDKYDATMQILNTASAIQKEGPLYYVISRYTPIPEFAEKAGFAYNSETNQMVVLLLKGDVHKLLYETVDKAAKKVAPDLPKEFELLIHPDRLMDRVIDQAKDAATDAAVKAIGVDASTADLLKQATQPGEMNNITTDAASKSTGIDQSTADLLKQATNPETREKMLTEALKKQAEATEPATTSETATPAP